MRGRFDPVAAVVFFAIAAFVLALAVGVGFGVKNALHEDVETCTVTSKERLPKGGDAGGFDQRVYTEECGVLTVGDSLFAGHFNSADTWNSIEEGHTYRLTARGYRVGFLSMFPNIVKAEEVTR